MTTTRATDTVPCRKKCCCDCRGLMGPSENYHALFLQHVGIDLAHANVAGGTGRCINFTAGGGTDGIPVFQRAIKPTLTIGGHGADAAIDYRALKCTMVSRRGLEAYATSQTNPFNSNCCHRVWPWGYTPIRFGDVSGFLPACYTSSGVAADADHTYTRTGDFFLEGPSAVLGSVPPGGSRYDHLNRVYMEDDWLLLAFDGDVAIDPPDDDWRVENGIPATGDYYLASFDPDDTYRYTGIFRIGTQWYARTLRADPMGDWLLVDDTSRTLTKQTAYATSSHDACVWVDPEFRAAVTYATNAGVQGVIGNVQGLAPTAPPVAVGDEAGIWPDVATGVAGAKLPWDDHAATFRKPYLFAWGDSNAADAAFPDPAGDGVEGFSGHTAADSSVAFTNVTLHPDYLAFDPDNPVQFRGLQGFLLTPDGEDVFGCRRWCESNETFSCFLSHAAGTTEQEFGMRRLRLEDVENMQDVFWRYWMGLPAAANYPRPTESSAGFETWIGFSDEGATSIVNAPAFRAVNAENPSEGVFQYNYTRHWYWADDAFDSMRTDAFTLFPTVLPTERWTECQPLHVFVGAAGTRRVLLTAALDGEILEDDVLATLEWKAGEATPPSDPSPMGPWTAQISGVIDPVPSVPGIETTTRDGEVFALVAVNGSSRWLHFQQHGFGTSFGVVRGLEDGSNTISFPALPDTYYQIIVTKVGVCGAVPQTTNGSSTTFTVDGHHVTVEVATSDEPFETPPPPPLPVIPICSFPFSNTPQCEGYGGGGGGEEMMMLAPFDLDPTEPEPA